MSRRCVLSLSALTRTGIHTDTSPAAVPTTSDRSPMRYASDVIATPAGAMLEVPVRTGREAYRTSKWKRLPSAVPTERVSLRVSNTRAVTVLDTLAVRSTGDPPEFRTYQTRPVSVRATAPVPASEN